jgi:hypothetical protein
MSVGVGLGHEGADTRVRDKAVSAVTAGRNGVGSGSRSAEQPAPSTCSSPGFVGRGIAYIAIGAMAVMMAFGVARHEPDRAGGHRGDRRQAVRIPAVVNPGHRVPRNDPVWRSCPGRGAAAEPDRGPPGQSTGLRHRLCHRVRQHLGRRRELRSFAQSPFGPWLLILVALGLIAFGILSFLEAKWRRTFGGVPA